MTTAPSITCPRCGWTSFNLNDIEQRYCGHCHTFHEDMEENPMPPFHFRPELIHLLKWFSDSPDAGTPECICSFCSKMIDEGEMPLRIFHDSDNIEMRLHMDCATQVIVEMTPQPTLADIMDRIAEQTKKSAAYAEGWNAFEDATRRGANPYSGNPNREDWFAGWDAAWERANGQPGETSAKN